MRLNPRRTLSVLLSCSVLWTSGAQASTALDDSWHVFAHTDIEPSIMALGYSVYAGVKPRSAPWQLGLGFYSFNQDPGYISFLAPSNAGFQVHETVATAFAKYYFLVDPIPRFFDAPQGSARGLFASGYLGYAGHSLALAGVAETANPSYLFMSAGVGYQWFPFTRYFYFEPSLGASYEIPIAGSQTVGGRTFANTVRPIFFLNLGIEI